MYCSACGRCAPVMSEGAAETLARYGVLFRCDTLSPEIRNRAGTGLCPMEQAVRVSARRRRRWPRSAGRCGNYRNNGKENYLWCFANFRINGFFRPRAGRYASAGRRRITPPSMSRGGGNGRLCHGARRELLRYRLWLSRRPFRGGDEESTLPLSPTGISLPTNFPATTFPTWIRWRRSLRSS